MVAMNGKKEFTPIRFILPDNKKEADVILWEAERQAEANKRRFFNIGFGALYDNMSFASYNVENAIQKECMENGLRFAHRVTEGSFCNLILEGPCGTGKTSLMACIAREVVTHENNKNGFKELYGVCNHFTASYHKSAEVSEKFVRSQSFSAKEDFGRSLVEDFGTDLVIVDEVGTGGAKESDALYELIDWCSRKSLCLMFATNLDNKKFGDILGIRACSRLRGVTNIIKFNGIEDQRDRYNKLR